MAFNIDTFKGVLPGGGARPTLFSVELTGAEYYKVPFLAKAASLPASTLGTIELSYFGRKVKVAGDRTYAEWSITIINDEDFAVRKYIEKWMAGIASHPGNVRTAGAVGPSAYTADLSVKQLGKSGSATALRTYTFEDAFPTDIAEIPLDWGDTDTIEEFSVTWSYQFWTAS